jgi:transcriptional regulator with XRE-family HTH domain
MMVDGSIGQKIKEFRMRRMLTLDKLAAYTGFSKSYLSRVENSKKNPPISTLTRISQALSVNFLDLFPGNGDGNNPPLRFAVTTRDENKQEERAGHSSGHIYRPLAYEKTNKAMKPYIVIPGFAKQINLQHEHEGEEFIYVLEGKLEFFYAGDRRILEQGESIYFDTSVPHFGRSLGGQKAKLLIVIYQPEKKE